MPSHAKALGDRVVQEPINVSLFYRRRRPRYNEAHNSYPLFISMRTGVMHMTGTLAFLVFISLIARSRAIPLGIDGIAGFAVSCALLLLARLEGAISWQTEIDTGTSAAATLSAPDTLLPEHRPPPPRRRRRRAQSPQRRPWSVWMELLRPRQPTWPVRARPLRTYLLVQPAQALSQLLSQRLSRSRGLPPRPRHHSVTFLIPAPGVSIASG
jgi:hypothetical protein